MDTGLVITLPPSILFEAETFPPAEAGVLCFSELLPIVL